MWMTILLRLLDKRPPAPAVSDGGAQTRPELADDRPLGCGWFDSSHELQSGLVVTEHSAADCVARDLALSDWLGLQLAGWPTGAAGPCPA